MLHFLGLAMRCLLSSLTTTTCSCTRFRPYRFARHIASNAASTTIDLSDCCSRAGLDPSDSRFHAPMVYHEDYSFEGWPENHTFKVSERVAE